MKIPPLVWGVGIVCLFLIFSDSKGCNIGVTTKAPYVVPANIPVTVAVAYDPTPTATLQLTKDYPGVVGHIQDWVKTHNGEFRLIGTDVKTVPGYDVQWVQDAWKALDRDHPPTMIAATPTSGVPSSPLPKTIAEVDALLSPLVK